MPIITTDIHTLSDLQTWASVTVPTDVVASGNSYVGLMHNDIGEYFSSTGTLCNLSSRNTLVGNSITLKAAPGESFSDNAGVRTNRLSYNQANGVAMRCTFAGGHCVDVLSTDFVTISGLQMQVTNDNDQCVRQNTANPIVSNCLMLHTGSASPPVTYGVFQNCVFVVDTSWNAMIIDNHTATMNFCTGIWLSDSANTATWAVFDRGGGGTFENVALFTPATTFLGGSDTITYTTCMASPATSHAGVTGSIAYSTSSGAKFVGTTIAAYDPRIQSGSSLVGAGTAIGGITTDISGFTRATPPGIGAWELAAAAATNVPIWMYFGQSMALGAGAKLARDLIRNPIRSRRRLLTGRDDR